MSYTVVPLGRTYPNGGAVITQQPVQYPQIISIPDAYASAVVPLAPNVERPQYPDMMSEPVGPSRPIIKEVDTDDGCCKGCCGSNDRDDDIDDMDDECCGGGCCGGKKYDDEIDQDDACCGGSGGCCGERGDCCGGDGGMCCGKRGGGCCNGGTEEIVTDARMNPDMMDQPDWQMSQSQPQQQMSQFQPQQQMVPQPMYRPAVTYVPTRRLVPVQIRQPQVISPITLSYPQKPVRVVSLAPQATTVYPFQHSHAIPRIIQY